jgi:hypothetical protein
MRSAKGIELASAGAVLLGALQLAALVGARRATAENILVPLADDRWRVRLVRAVEDIESGDTSRGLSVLQRALEEGQNLLLRVPAKLEANAGATARALKRLSEEAAARPPFRGEEPADVLDPVPAPRQGLEDDENARYLNLSLVAQSLLESLPGAVIAEYRQRYGGAAASLQARFEAGGGREALEELAGKFALTEEGDAAREQLADLLLEEGSYRSAFVHYRALLERHAAGSGKRSRLGGKALLCLRLLGDGSSYAALRAELSAEAEPGGELAGVLERLERELALVPADERPPAAAPSRWGGELEAGRPPDLPGGPLQFSWDSWMWSKSVGDGSEDPALRAPRFDFRGERRHPPAGAGYCFVPLVDGDEIYLSGVFKLYRFDGRPGSGKLLQEITKPSPFHLLRPPEFKETSESPLYTSTLWRRSREPQAPRLGRRSRAAIPEELLITHYVSDRVPYTQYSGYDITVQIAHRSLMALDPQSGRIIWTSPEGPRPVGGERGAGAVKPMDVSFISPVVVKDGLAFAAGWRQEGYISSVVRGLDLASGETVWETLICGSQLEMTMFGEVAREPFGSFLIEREGILYFHSNLGVVAALEARSGRPLWVTEYDVIQKEPTMLRNALLRRLPWGANPPLLVGHLLFVTPRDSHSIYAIDTGTGPGGERQAGSILWAHGNENGDLRELLGYYRGSLYFTGPAGVTALDVSSLLLGGDAVAGGGDGGAAPQPRLRRSSFRSPRGQIKAGGLLTSSGVVYSDQDGLWLVDFALASRRPLLAGLLPRSAHGEYPGRVQLAGSQVLVTSRQLLSAFQGRTR